LQWQHPHSLLYVMQQEKVHSFIDVKVMFEFALLSQKDFQVFATVFQLVRR
jgi:hypothetical protein